MTIAGGQSLNGRAPYAIEAHTANFTLTAAECGTLHTSVGAGGTIVAQLPAASAANMGLHYKFYVGEAQELRIEPDGTDTISLPSSGAPESAGDYITANAEGEIVEVIVVEVGRWAAFGTVGTWTGQ